MRYMNLHFTYLLTYFTYYNKIFLRYVCGLPICFYLSLTFFVKRFYFQIKGAGAQYPKWQIRP